METHLIPEFSELIFCAASEKYDELAEALTAHLPGSWARAQERERSDRLSGIDYRIFERVDSPSRPAALLFLVPNEAGDVYVANIVPLGSGDLGKDRYNAILSEFAEAAAKPAAAELGLRLELTPALIDLKDELGAEAFNKLSLFSVTANKHSSHPLDRERWRDFIITAHRHGITVRSDHVREWLVMDGWEHRRADDLEDEMSFGLELLADAE